MHECLHKEKQYVLQEQMFNCTDPSFQTNSNKKYTESIAVPEITKQTDDEWYYINDEIVQRCKRKDAIDNKDAYILMYVKK